MEKTAVIGTSFVDLKGFSNSIYDPQGRNLGNVKIVQGGVGRNVVENFANVGMPISYVGMLEESSIGHDIKNHLLEIGVDLSHVVIAPENGIGMWLVILDENGNLAGSISKMPDMTILEKYLEEQGEQIVKEADSVILEIDLNEHIAEMIVKCAGDYGKPVYSIVGNMSVALARKDLVQQTDCFICNEFEAEKFFNNEISHFSVKEMLSYIPDAVIREHLPSMVVTMGAKGAVFYDAKTRNAGFCPPCPTNVIDTSGAGDAFFSGTVMGLIRSNPLSEAVKYGAKLASATISRTETNCPINKHFFDEN